MKEERGDVRTNDSDENPILRRSLARQVEMDAQAITYKKVGVSRAVLFRQKFGQFRKVAKS